MTSLPPDRQLLSDFWRDAFTADGGLWHAPWKPTLDSLNAPQAAWTPPAPARHSIWQHVLHMCFWRERGLHLLTHPTAKPTTEEIAAHNFPPLTDTSDHAWDAAKARFAATQDHIAAVFADPAADTARLRYMIPHDAYHFGQINLLRALQGLPPLE